MLTCESFAVFPKSDWISNSREMLNKSNINVIFVTGDLINALMALAENINTIYTFSTNKFNRPYGHSMDRLLYTVANMYEHCEFIIRTNASDKEERYAAICVWQRKTVEEWANKKIQINKIMNP